LGATIKPADSRFYHVVAKARDWVQREKTRRVDQARKNRLGNIEDPHLQKCKLIVVWGRLKKSSGGRGGIGMTEVAKS